MKLPSLSRLGFATGVVIGLLIVNIALTGYFTRQLYQEGIRVEHTYQVINGLGDILSLAKDAETGGRGYVITGDESYLEPYNAAHASIDAKVSEVQRLTDDNPAQQARFPELKKRIADRMETLDGVIALSRTTGFAAARQSMLTNRGRDEMDSVREFVAEMVQHEQSLLLERERRTARTYWMAELAGLLSGLLALVAILGRFWLVGKHNAAREESARVIAEQAERLRTTLASIGDAVITTDDQGRVTNLNAVAESMTGWTNNDAAGRPLEEVFKIVNEDTRELVENPAIRALREGRVVGLANHTVLISKDGIEYPIDDSAAPIKDDKGAILGIILVFHDVTSRRLADKALRRSEQDLRDFFDNATIGFHWVGPDGIVQKVNKAELDLLGYKREEYVGRHISDFHVDSEAIEEILQRLAMGEPIHEYPARLRCKDGAIKHVSISSSVLWEGDEFVHTRCFTRDVTEKREAHESAARLAAIVESSDDAIISKDLNGVIKTWNQAAERIFGYTSDEAIGRNISFIIPEERQHEEDEVLARLRVGKKVDHFETERQAKDGTRLKISLTVSPIRDSEGRIIGASKVARDVTEERRAEESLRDSEQRLRLALDAGRMGTWEWKIDANEVIWSPGLEVIHGLAPGEFAGTFAAYSDDIHPDDRERVLGAMNQTLNEGTDHSIEYRLLLADGTIRWVEGRGKLFRDAAGKPSRMVGVCIDITERRRNHEALQKLAAELSEADHRKNEFLAMLAHELRNPLAPISNAVKIMRMTGNSGAQAATEMMERQVGQLVRLVDDLLDVSRITQGKIELRRERIELASVVHHAVEAAKPSCENGGVDLQVDMSSEPIYLSGDQTRLAQVIGNLLNNSCKFTDKGGRINLVVKRDEGDAVIRVRDTGIGIASDQISQIFELFVQADTSLERSVSGLGIGLTLVKNLVEMHDGTIEAHSEGLGKGSEFVIRIPVAESAKKRDMIDISEPADTLAGKLRILVVDDNEDSAESLALLLKISGHEVEMANDGKAAVDMASSFAPEVILLDIGLPKLNGYEAARAIREKPNGESINLIALTGWGQEEDRQRSKEAGFDGHMVKPVDHVDLMKRLEEISTQKNGAT